MDKIIQLEDRFPTGEPTVQAVLRAAHGRFHLEKTAFLKTASPALDYIQAILPEPGHTYILVNALGAFEAYDSNRNGDGFNYRPYRVGVQAPAYKKDYGDPMIGWVSPEEVLTRHYHTFEQAHAFQHHINKDPGKSFGNVQKAFWNDRMQRVELLLKLINDRNPPLVERINDGDHPAVSMGCFLAGTLITMADGTRKPIETIVVGDMVRTHKGRARKVTELHTRPYRGSIHAIQAEAHEPVYCTNEHPFYAVNRDSVKRKDDKANFRWDLQRPLNPEWRHAECLDQEQFLLEPVDETVVTPEFVDRTFARLFGYYLAEGHVLRNRKKEIVGLEFSTHRNDAIHDEIEYLCEQFGTRNPPVTSHRPHSDDARSIVVFDERLAQLCYEHGGSYAKQKHLSASAMQWHPEYQLEMFGAYANGDGHGPDDGSLKISTASDHLAWQWISILHRSNILPSISNLTHKAGAGFNAHVTYEWVLHIGKQAAQQLHAVCQKIQLREVLLSKNSRHIKDGYVLTPIRNIDISTAETTVYNFEVAEDESYIAGGLAVHNCRVKWDVCTFCGNRAPTRKDYCEHLRYRMNEIDPSTGIRFCALNPSPFFFDISFVTKPADQTGYMLKKVAHEIWSSPPSTELEEKVATYNAKQATVRKLSDIQKRITGGEVTKSKTTPEDKLIEGYRDGLLAENTGNLPVASEREVTAMAQYPLRTVLATLHKVGAFLSTGELARVFLSRNHTKLGSDTLGRLVLLQPAVLEAFARYPDAYDKAAELVQFSEKDASSKLLAELKPWIEKRSTMGEYLQQRIHEPGGPLGGMSWGPGYAYEAGAPAKSDLMTMTDPHTGQVYRTTRGASQAADAANRRAVLGGTALLGGAYTLGLGLVPHLPLPAKLGLGLGAGYLTARKLLQAQQPYHHPAYMTDQGTLVPGNTEFMKSSSVTPSVRLLDKLAFDYVERLGGWPVGDRLEDTLLRKQGSTEILSLLHGNRIEKVANLLSRYETHQYDSSEPPKIGFHHLSDVFGQLVAGA